ncbi:MAG TPA: hypothetical protein VJK03_03600 [Candidatus Nanoarchaeia archaeon]|nr:hypothetical protein [Candidatus Nanoarchaeia archaeon]
MKAAKFREVEERFYKDRKRLEDIKTGDLIWEPVGRGGDIDYHPAVVLKVDVDECVIEVIDVSDRNKRKRYTIFMTAPELASALGRTNGFSEEYKTYRTIINDVKRGVYNG